KTGTSYYKASTAAKDSVLKKFISMADTLLQYDTSAIEFRLLKAYSLNDIINLKKFVAYSNWYFSSPNPA
ncbi:MAG TPA: hypothetical protein VF476_08590, partial [Chitinophagaceae bacterium]